MFIFPQDADIFVGPEYGVQSLEMQREDPVLMKEYSQRVPDPALGVVPCDEEEDLSYYEVKEQCFKLKPRANVSQDMQTRANMIFCAIGLR